MGSEKVGFHGIVHAFGARFMLAGLVFSEPAQAAWLVIDWLENQRSWLLVIDNLDDIKVINGYLPANSVKKHTLITTRNLNAENIPAQGLEVDLMSLKDATKFFLIRGTLRLIPLRQPKL